jgi:hypothetical protein
MLIYRLLTASLARTSSWNLLWNVSFVYGDLVWREMAEVDAVVFSRSCRLSLNINK